MNYPEELQAVARRVVWFEAPEESLRYPKRFLTYVMTYATLEEILITRKYFTHEDFRAALFDPPPGIFDPRSWAYWNGVFGRWPAPPLPERHIP
jgi:hypothetical protein